MNENKNKITPITVPKGKTSSRGEHPGKPRNAGEGSEAPKHRQKFSGAARRRYRKQMLAGESVANKASSNPSASCSKDGAGGGGASGGAAKRARSERTTPSPSAKRQEKRPKKEGSYAQATVGLVRMALAYENYPDKKVGADEVSEIRKLIRSLILGMSGDDKAPTFIGSWERDGALIVVCANEESAEWLKVHSLDLKVRGTPLCVLPVGELPRRRRVVVHVEEPEIEVEEALKLLNQQNTGLATSEWVVTRRSYSRDASSAHFSCLVGDSTLEALKHCGFRPFLGLGRATIRVVGRERGEATEKETVSEAVETAYKMALLGIQMTD